MIETVEERRERLDRAADFLANLYHDHSPLDDDADISRQKWKKHIIETDGDIDAHYGANGQGKEEYLAFTKQNDVVRVRKNILNEIRARKGRLINAGN